MVGVGPGLTAKTANGSVATEAPSAHQAESQMQVMPIPKIGAFCPRGYHAEGNMCVPDRGAKPAIAKVGSFCPRGYHAEGSYCVADGPNSKNVFPKSGTFCPRGYHADGDYCVED